MVLLEATIPLTLSTIKALLGSEKAPDRRVEIWTLDPLIRRRRAEKNLQRAGINARVRSAYKPLVHAFREEITLAPDDKVTIHYPVVAEAPENRFRMETYPLDAMIGGDRLALVPQPCRTDIPTYSVEVIGVDGARRRETVLAPNHLARDHLGASTFSPTGWIRLHEGGALVRSERLETDLEIAFRRIVAAIAGAQWPQQDPCFDRLVLHVSAPFEDEPLGNGNEASSLAEAMHEDLYFSALEIFAQRRGLPQGDRTIRPGQIVPDIRARKGPVRVRVASEPHQPPAKPLRPRRHPDLDGAEASLSPSGIAGALRALGGEMFSVPSQQGRSVEASVIGHGDVGMVVSAGQHANETSGIVGALRAARDLAQDPGLRVAVSPLENPDGYALFRSLIRHHPGHMHHAARYTASGADLEFMPAVHEVEIRHRALERTGAWLHLNLHGYPAHEWTRPFTGYIPRGFESWTIPKGFFLILRHGPGWRERGEMILAAILADLQSFSPLVAMNRVQLARQAFYGAPHDFELRGDFPVFIREVPHPLFPVTIITEAPDETIRGADFIMAHTAQMRAVRAAATRLKADHVGPAEDDSTLV